MVRTASGAHAVEKGGQPPMRDLLHAELTHTFGPPTTRLAKDDGRAWWIVSRDKVADVHICVDAQSTSELARVLVFNPRNHREPVQMYAAHTPAEARQVIEELRGLVPH